VSTAWRFGALGGATAGLAMAPFAPPPPLSPGAALGLVLLAGFGLVAVRPRAGRGHASMRSPGELAHADRRPRSGRVAGAAWLAALALLAATAGLVVGGARVDAIDAGAFAGAPGERVSVRGFVSGVPRPQDGMVLVPVDTADGRLAVEAPEPERELRVGGEVRATGVVRAPEPWRAGRLRVAGIHRLVAPAAIEPTARRRGGLHGLVDSARERAEQALERGVPDREAALARGFVLGQDDRLDPQTVDDFRRSGLAHLLAVSGQNVLLLALLAVPVLALLGVSLRARLAVVLALIALYVPITGASASIQRAAVMGAAGIVAVLAGRPSHRWYALLLAAAVTLAVNPRAAADIGWQLSFAAVAGILLWARHLARLVGGARPSTLRRALGEGVGITVAATIATAPISALHFEAVTPASLPANLLALPAVAPVMWLGMLSAALGQWPALPVEPLNWLCSLLVAYIAQVAHWLGSPGWASVAIPPPGAAALALVGLALPLAGALLVRLGARRAGLRPVALARAGPAVAALAVAVVAAIVAPAADRGSPSTQADAPRLTIAVLDVGQGDAILLDPEPGGAVLVDAGPPGSGVAADLAERELSSLSAAIVTHDQSDHAGGMAEVLRTVSAEAVVFADAGRELRIAARSSGSRLTRVGRGDVLRVGRLRLEVLWPPSRPHVPGSSTRAPASGGPAGDPNARSLVLLARWRRFTALLTGDAEAELAPVDPGPVDLLKLAHHGSADAGLPHLLESARPRLAAISVGAGNPYGHPHPATLDALAEAGVPVLRTDSDGDVELVVEDDTVRLTG
jgi:competence protein ComEC